MHLINTNTYVHTFKEKRKYLQNGALDPGKQRLYIGFMVIGSNTLTMSSWHYSVPQRANLMSGV